MRGLQGGLDVCRIGIGHMAHQVARVGRVEHRTRHRCRCRTIHHRARCPGCCGGFKQRFVQHFQADFVAQVQAAGVGAVGRGTGFQQLSRQGDGGVRQSSLAAWLALPPHGLHRVFNQVVYGQRGVRHAVHERGVGTVLQQAAHQVSQQGFVGTHGRIDAAGPPQLAVLGILGILVGAHHLFVQRLAHAVQALELVVPFGKARPGQSVDGGQGLRIVRGELRIDLRWGRQQFAGAGQIRHISMRLARVHGKAVLAVHLSAFDFAVPIGTFHQADHEPVPAAAGQVDEPDHHEGAALLVGLDDKANAVPASQARLKTKAFQQVERQLQAVRFFGIDVDADVMVSGQCGQMQEAGIQLLHHTLRLGAAVTRVQGRQLDRDARPPVNAKALGRLTDGMDGCLVRGQIALGVVLCHRRFAQHVIRIPKTLGFAGARVDQRLVDSFARDKLFPHHAQAEIDAFAHQRLAAFCHRPPQGSGQALFAVRGDQLAGQQQSPSRRVDKERRAGAHVGLPVPAADLVADQGIACSRVGDAQQRFGQAHQGHAFLAGQGELAQQALHQAGPPQGLFLLAQALGQLPCQVVGGCLPGRILAGQLQHGLHRLGFGQAVGHGNGVAQGRLTLLRIERLVKVCKWVAARGLAAKFDCGVHASSSNPVTAAARA